MTAPQPRKHRVRRPVDPTIEERGEQRRQALARAQAFHRLRREAGERLRALREAIATRH